MIFIIAAASAGTWKELTVDQAEATSWLVSDWNKYEENYHPNYAFDDDPKTAWVEGDEGIGVGAQLSWRLTDTVATRYRISIRNGYQKSEALLAANAAPTKLRLATASQTLAELVITPTMGWQSFEFTTRGGELDWLELTVVEGVAGKKYEDLCITDIRIEAQDPKGYNEALQANRRAALKSWRSTRIQTARTMATLGAEYPWGSTRFSSKDSALTKPDAVRELAEVRGHLLAMVTSTLGWQTRSVVRRWPMPDGVHIEDDVDLRLTDATYAEAKAELSGKGEGQPPWPIGGWGGAYQRWWASNTRIHQAPDGGTFVYNWRRTIVEERSTYDTTEQVLSWYDAQGRLGWVYTHEGSERERLLRFAWSGEKLRGMEMVFLADGVWSEYGLEEEQARRTVTTAK